MHAQVPQEVLLASLRRICRLPREDRPRGCANLFAVEVMHAALLNSASPDRVEFLSAEPLRVGAAVLVEFFTSAGGFCFDRLVRIRNRAVRAEGAYVVGAEFANQIQWTQVAELLA